MFKNLSIKAKKMSACAALMAGLVSGVAFTGTAYANSVSYIPATISETQSFTYTKGIEKTSETGTAAKVTIHQNISEKNSVKVVSINADGDRVSGNAASFHYDTANTTKNIPYLSGKGKKGNKFRPKFTLATGSADKTLKFTFSYTA